MRGPKRRFGALLAAGVLALTAAAVAAGSSTGSSAAKAEGGSLTVWLSGTYAGSTPGSTYRKWLDGIKARYEKTYPGSSVKFVLTPINNAQFTAQIAAAFASRRVPDVMLVYSGGYTTPYMLSSLEKLNDRVGQTPGFYGKPDRLGSLLPRTSTARAARATSTPSRTTRERTGCSTTRRCSARPGSRRRRRPTRSSSRSAPSFKSKGILPLAYGDRDGYSTDNWVTYDYASYMAPRRHRQGQRRQDEVRGPEAREAACRARQVQAAGLREPRCVDAREQRREHLLHLRQGSDGADVPVRDQGLREGARQEPRHRTAAAVRAESGTHRRQLVPQLGDPEERGQQGRGVGVHQDGRRQSRAPPSSPRPSGPCRPTRSPADGSRTRSPSSSCRRRPSRRFRCSTASCPLKIALLYYQQLQAAFSGKSTALQAMQNVDKGLKSLNP